MQTTSMNFTAPNTTAATTTTEKKPKVVKTTRTWLAEATNALDHAYEETTDAGLKAQIQAALVAALTAQNHMLRGGIPNA